MARYKFYALRFSIPCAKLVCWYVCFYRLRVKGVGNGPKASPLFSRVVRRIYRAGIFTFSSVLVCTLTNTSLFTCLTMLFSIPSKGFHERCACVQSLCMIVLFQCCGAEMLVLGTSYGTSCLLML
jgi:hypothetical protein